MPDNTNIGVYPIDSAIKPAYNIEKNSESLIGIWSNPISTDIHLLFFVVLAIMDSKNPIQSPSTTAKIENSTRKLPSELDNKNEAKIAIELCKITRLNPNEVLSATKVTPDEIKL